MPVADARLLHLWRLAHLGTNSDFPRLRGLRGSGPVADGAARTSAVLAPQTAQGTTARLSAGRCVVAAKRVGEVGLCCSGVSDRLLIADQAVLFSA